MLYFTLVVHNEGVQPVYIYLLSSLLIIEVNSSGLGICITLSKCSNTAYNDLIKLLN